MNNTILKLDRSGLPTEWISVEKAIHHYASDEVVFDMGDTIATLRGGWNKNGVRSELSAKSIIAVRGTAVTAKATATLTGNDRLFRRDHCICGFCGQMFHEHELTRDHIMPHSRGGKDTWMNLITSCKPCNNRKGNKTPEEAHMQLVYVPYVPSRAEGFILANRRILSDQMEYLAAKLPAHSRWKL